MGTARRSSQPPASRPPSSPSCPSRWLVTTARWWLPEWLPALPSLWLTALLTTVVWSALPRLWWAPPLITWVRERPSPQLRPMPPSLDPTSPTPDLLRSRRPRHRSPSLSVTPSLSNSARRSQHTPRRVARTVCAEHVDVTTIEDCQEVITTKCHQVSQSVAHASNVVGHDTRVGPAAVVAVDAHHAPVHHAPVHAAHHAPVHAVRVPAHRAVLRG